MRPEPRSGAGGDRDRAQPQSLPEEERAGPRPRPPRGLGQVTPSRWLPGHHLASEPQFPLQREGAKAGLPCPAPCLLLPAGGLCLQGAQVPGPHLPPDLPALPGPAPTN